MFSTKDATLAEALRFVWFVLRGQALTFEVRQPKKRARLRRTFLTLLAFAVPWLLLFAAPTVTQHSGGHHSVHFLDWALFILAVLWTGAVFVATVAWFLLTSRLEEYKARYVALEVALGVTSVLAVFAFADWMFSRLDAGSFGTPALSRPDAAYFAIATFTTAGTGQLGPVTGGARLFVALQTLLGFALITGAIGAIVGRALTAYDKRRSPIVLDPPPQRGIGAPEPQRRTPPEGGGPT